MEVLSHLLFLGTEVALVVLIGRDLNRDVLHHLEAVALETDPLDGVIGHEAHLTDAELLEYLSTDTIVPLIGSMTEVDIGLDGVHPLLLELVGVDLVHEPDATALLIEVDDGSTALMLHQLHSLVQLLATLAAEGAEDVPRGAAAVDANQHRSTIRDFTLDERDVL